MASPVDKVAELWDTLRGKRRPQDQGFATESRANNVTPLEFMQNSINKGPVEDPAWSEITLGDEEEAYPGQLYGNDSDPRGYFIPSTGVQSGESVEVGDVDADLSDLWDMLREADPQVENGYALGPGVEPSWREPPTPVMDFTDRDDIQTPMEVDAPKLGGDEPPPDPRRMSPEALDQYIAYLSKLRGG
jgi:hypothetical protein